jgi:hypothetical protein
MSYKSIPLKNQHIGRVTQQLTKARARIQSIVDRIPEPLTPQAHLQLTILLTSLEDLIRSPTVNTLRSRLSSQDEFGGATSIRLSTPLRRAELAKDNSDLPLHNSTSHHTADFAAQRAPDIAVTSHMPPVPSDPTPHDSRDFVGTPTYPPINRFSQKSRIGQFRTAYRQ